MAAYYNEFKPEAAHMLRQLIKDGLIADGEVDERSITEVTADDVKGFTQCHFFAGIGGWSVALRQAMWPDDRPVWTGSCPCQPFSAAAGKEGKSQSDVRHLWPTFARLISQLRPPTVFGEQVDEAISAGWLDDAFHDLEAAAYSCAAAVLPIYYVEEATERSRLFFVAHAPDQRLEGVEHWEQKNDKQRDKYVPIFPPFSLRDGPPGQDRLPCPPLCSKADGLFGTAPLLHAIGNAIHPKVASKFIQASI
jgi:DNA (cytosine-5)-methyltransferase 1